MTLQPTTPARHTPTPAPTQAPQGGVDDWTGVLVHVRQLSSVIARTAFVQDAHRGNEDSVAAAIMYGREIGLSPMMALRSIDIIKGNPSLSAEAMRALILSHGHQLHVEESNSSRCVMSGRRAGQSEWTTVTYSMDDAKRAGIAGGQNYRSRPQEMMVARATTRLARLIFPDVIAGLASVEELDDDSADDTTPAPAKRSTRRTTKPKRQPVASVAADAPEPAPDLPPLPDAEPAAAAPEPATDSTPAVATQPQLVKIAASTKELGVDDRDNRLHLLTALVGRTITSGKDLTKGEASQVIETLTQIQAGPDAEAQIDLILNPPKDA